MEYHFWEGAGVGKKSFIQHQVYSAETRTQGLFCMGLRSHVARPPCSSVILTCDSKKNTNKNALMPLTKGTVRPDVKLLRDELLTRSKDKFTELVKSLRPGRVHRRSHGKQRDYHQQPNK